MSVALDGTFCHRKKYRTDKSGNTAESYVKRTKESSEDTIRAYEPSGRSAFYFSHQIRSRFTQTVRLQYTCYKQDHNKNCHASVRYKVCSKCFKKSVNSKTSCKSGRHCR